VDVFGVSVEYDVTVEPVLLKSPRGVLEGSCPASVETVPLAGLYMASGTLGREGSVLSTAIWGRGGGGI
jgi:hypothetical protein